MSKAPARAAAMARASLRPFAVRRSFLSRITMLFLSMLAFLLIINGFAYILYTTSMQYQESLHVFATVQAQSTRHVVNATRMTIQSTTNALGTTQANINATATTINSSVATATASTDVATATASALSHMFTQATQGTPTLDDPLSDNSGTGKWDEGSSTTNTGCIFQDQYNVQEATQGFLQPCIAEASNVSNNNATYQVSLSIIAGYRGQAGLLFHVNSSNKAFYFFHIGIDNTYALDLYHDNGKADTLSRGFSTTISAGLKQPNQLAVIAHNNTYFLFINGTSITTVNDSTLDGDKIGVAVINNGTPVIAQFSHAKVWQVQPAN